MGKKPSDKSVNIFNYFGYREFFKDAYELLKRNRSAYSYRVFSKEAGISSHNLLPRILKNQRNLTSEFIPKLAEYLRLSAKEAKYLQVLVAFNNAKKPSDKERFLKLLLSVRVANEEFRIEDDKLHFFDKWYYPVVRELVVICDFREDYNKLARNCIPRISAHQAESAVAFLLKNDLIRKDATGRYSVTDAIIATEPEVDSAIIPKYHRITMQQCVDSIDIIKKEDRNFSSSTLLVSKELYEDIKKEIYQFRKRLLSMAKDCKNPEMVCYTGFQLLPRSELIPNETGAHVNESENGSYEIL